MKSEKQSVILDPSGRFEKKDETLSVHSNVICFKGYDRESGLEVSWYEIDCLNISNEQKQKLEKRAMTVKGFKFNSLLSVFTYWFNNERTVFYLITESVNSKSVRDQIKEGQPLRIRTIQKMAASVLQSLNFLHTQPVPVTHNRVDLNSIFIKASSKFVKLMSPLLNPYLLRYENHELRLRYSTPPEALYNKNSPASDIWCFGIAILYSYTLEQPYSECKGPNALIQKLRNYEPPASLSKVNDQHLRSFIMSCLVPPERRPTAMELLNHSFFMQTYEQPSTENQSLNRNFELLIVQPTPSTPVGSAGVIATVQQPAFIPISTKNVITGSTPHLNK